MSAFRILIAPIDETGVLEVLSFDEAQAHCFPTEQYLAIRTEPTGTGRYAKERCVPWHRVLDYQEDKT